MASEKILHQKEKKRKSLRQIQCEERLAKTGVAELQRLLKTPSGLVLNNINIPTWKNLTKADKLFGLFTFILKEKYISFTLRFSHKFMERANKCKKDLTTCVSERIRQNLKNNMGSYAPLFLMVAEYDRPKTEEDNSFHVHGVIEFSRMEHILTKKYLKATAFGRHYKNSKMNCNIVRTKSLYNAVGWLEYITKAKHVAYESIYVSRELNALYRDFYNSARKKILKKKGL